MTKAAGHSPLVSAIVSTYKAERFLAGKLADLEAQTIADRLEIIVIDSASPENERAIVEEFQRRYDNIRYLRTPERETVYQAWNRGIGMARGEFVTNANTDDRLRKDAYQTLVRALREHPECVLAYPDMRITEEENAIFEAHRPLGFRDWPPFDRSSLLELCCIGPFPLWRRSLHDEIGYFDERFRSAADYEFWLRAALSHDFVHVPEFLGLYWLSQETVSRKGELPTLEYLQVQREYRPRYAPLTPPPLPLTEAEEGQWRALARAAAGGAPEALAALERFADAHPRCGAPQQELAGIHYQKGEIGFAKKYFERAAIAEPGNAEYREKLQAFMKSELQQALKLHTAEAATNRDDLESRLSAGMILILMERFEAAREQYLRALEIDPKCAPARENLAFAERRLADNLPRPEGGQAPAEPPEGGQAPAEPVPSLERLLADCVPEGEGRGEGEGGGEPTDRGYYGHSRPEVQQLISRSARLVLDVGCAAGELGAAIKRRQGAEVWGVEPWREGAEKAAALLDRVIASPIEEALGELAERRFDSIVLADVLEHLVDPERVLAALLQKLAPGGEIVASLPNVRHWSVVKGLLEGEWEYQEAGILDRTHLRFFTRSSALSLFERAGCTVTGVTPVLLGGDPGMPRELLQALRSGGVESPTLEEESSAYQYLFRLVPKGNELTSIVILTFNELDCTRQCLQSIERNTPEPHEVILVDNGSGDGTVPFLREYCGGRKNHRLIENGENLGFAAGCNAGMRASRGGRILLLNNDVVVTRGWLSGMIDALEREPGAGITGPMTNEIAGPQRLPSVGYRNLEELEDFAARFRSEHYGRRIPVDRVVGFCLLFERRLLDEVGELDARFGSGNFEDDDFCLRAGLKGYGCVIAGDVFIHHYGSRSFTGNRIDYAAAMAKNRCAFDRKWDLAALDLELAARLASRNAQLRGRKLARQGRVSEAVDLLLQEGIRLLPASPLPYLSLAGILAEAGEHKNALEVLAELPAGEELQAALLKGRCRLALGEREEAARLAAQALRLDPQSPAALFLNALIAQSGGKAEEGEGLLRRSIAADPGFAPPYSALARLLWERGNREQALQLAEMGFVLAPDATERLGVYHEIATACGALAREEERLAQALAIYPEHRGLAYGMIELLIRTGRHGEAVGKIEEAAARFGLDDAGIDAALQIRKLAGTPQGAEGGKANVSLCMIVKDEQLQLARALFSARGLADEIVVVDTGSGDRSCDIAAVFGARVRRFPWSGSFAEARNFSLKQATGEWILVLDADEVLAPGDIAPLAALVRGGGRPTAYTFTTRNYTEEVTRKNWSPNAGEYPQQERGRGWTPSEKVRLFPNDPRLRFEGAVHELLEPSLIRCGIPIHACDVPVHHYGKLDAARNAVKQEKYYQLGMKKLREGGATVEALTELAVQATELKRFGEAEELWHRLLQLRPGSADAYFNLGYLHLCTGRYGKAREHALKGAELAPDMKEAAFNLAKCELYLGNTAAALAGVRKMLEKWPDYPPALSLLTVCLLLEGEVGEAEGLVRRLAGMRFDCVDFLKEYAGGLERGGRGDLAAPLDALAARLAVGGAP